MITPKTSSSGIPNLRAPDRSAVPWPDDLLVDENAQRSSVIDDEKVFPIHNPVQNVPGPEQETTPMHTTTMADPKHPVEIINEISLYSLSEGMHFTNTM
jgi:hypothetical protein